jgi:pyrimidine operon attenuation protein/uracil phosphoribosyltransferase
MKSFLQLFLLSLMIILGFFFYKSYFAEKNNLSQIEINNPKLKKDLDNSEVPLKKEDSLITNLKYNVELTESGQYEIKADKSKLVIDGDNEVILMENVIATFTDKNNKIIYITSDSAKFSSVNYNTFFRENIKIRYEENTINSNKLDFNFNDNSILIYDDVIYKGVNSTMQTDNIKINLITKKIKIFMDGSKNKVKIISN